MLSVDSFTRGHIKKNSLAIHVSQDIDNIVQERSILPTLCKKIKTLSKSAECMIVLAHIDTTVTWEPVYCSDDILRTCLDMPILENVVTKKQIIISNRISKDPRNLGYENKKIKTFCGIPIICSNLVYGAIVLINKKKGYKNSTLKRCQTFIELIGQTIISQDEIRVFEKQGHENLNFMSTLAHEIRTPIHGIVNMIGLALDYVKDKKQREFLECAICSADDLVQIVKDAIDFQKIQTGKLGIIHGEFNIKTLLEKILKLLSFKANLKNIYLKLHITQSLPAKIFSDKDRLFQILSNLIQNAIKFTDKGGVLVSATLAGGKILFSIKDTGCGISHQNIKKIFKRNFQSHNKGGLGIGLPLSNSLVRMMGGRITVESVLGEGSTFTVDIPYEEEFNSEELSSEKNPLMVLVIESNDKIRLVFRSYFSSWGISAEFVSTYEEGEMILSQREFDIVLIDTKTNMGYAYKISKSYKGKIVNLSDKPNSNFDANILDCFNKSQVYNCLLKTHKNSEKRKHPLRQSQSRICIVEDDKVSALALKEHVHRIMGVEATIIESGEQAVREITHSYYDIVFMDCKLKSRMSGIEATKLIRENVDTILIYGVTASITEEERVEWFNSGIDGLIMKPFDREILENMLSS